VKYVLVCGLFAVERPFEPTLSAREAGRKKARLHGEGGGPKLIEPSSFCTFYTNFDLN
jgi:hypothetical protein